MLYILVFVLLVTAQLVYFRLADHFNIIDKPNNRSSHTKITIRGGGIVFYIGVLLFFYAGRVYVSLVLSRADVDYSY